MNDNGKIDADPPEITERRSAIRRLGRAELVYFVALSLFTGLAVLAHHYNYFGWDLRFETELQEVTNPWVRLIFTGISLPGNFATPYLITLAIMVAFWLYGHRSEAVGLFAAAAGAGLINRTIKTLIGRPRPIASLVNLLPADRSGASFPSGHVAFYVCFFGFLFFVSYALLRRGSVIRWLALAVTAFPVLTIGLSRVYLGAHWPSDVLGGYLWSGVWLAIVLRLYLHWKKNSTFHRKKTGAIADPPVSS
jgi:undecaprenyl-diphosphatase